LVELFEFQEGDPPTRTTFVGLNEFPPARLETATGPPAPPRASTEPKLDVPPCLPEFTPYAVVFGATIAVEGVTVFCPPAPPEPTVIVTAVPSIMEVVVVIT
jgi:hypothetical protein